ncbi:cell wall-binding repeat-containing protein [Clostridium ljungdahlii]|uniref:N-acetylmuramoyl-L-alanine amidase LytC n=1 Tax=Clostridium ljungdahlii TaxID=1538 RepID=A0A162L6T8_9CLOT|nr:cell wall-binding repeat-containing protein [Clostridium ljungdahlii]OAA91922.1 N-acetylmuramoyl-L-alanine amidase LytC precursor [Clostridium ljungdahlii]
MWKTYERFIINSIFLFLICFLILIPESVHAASGQVSRIGEINRYATAAKSATTNWTSSKNVVLVCSEIYADAVSGVTLARKLDAPILLTTSNLLNLYTKSALDTLKPQNIYIIGGTSCVSQNIRNELKSYGYNLIELSGNNRYETNISVANELVKLGVNALNVMLVSGTGFSDALSAAPIAAAKGQILLLGSNDDDSMAPVLNFIKSNNSNATVIGTQNVLNENMYNKIGAVKRVNGGANRFETNLNMLNEYQDILKNDKLFIANAAGEDFPDPLIASSLAGKWSSPLVLVDGDNSPSTEEALNYIKNKVTNLTDLNAIGGKNVISDNIISKINNAISNDIVSVTTNGLNQIKITFNTEVNKETAESVGNYQIDGIDLTPNISSASLQDDNKTVLVTLANPYSQYRNAIFTVKSTVLDKNLNVITSNVEKEITFLDTTTPKVQSFTLYGNNKLILEFSEPIRISTDNLSSMKINGQSIMGLGLNTSLSTFYEKSEVWSMGVVLYFDIPLKEGVNTFKISRGISGEEFDNAAGFPIEETSINFDVNSLDGNPQIAEANYTTDGIIYITYNRSMDTKTALNINNYKINGNALTSSFINFCQGSNDKTVEIKVLNSLLNIGSNILSISDNVKDAYGNNICNGSNASFQIEDSTVKPQITQFEILDSQTINIKFNQYVMNIYATNKSNYKLLDSDGTDISYKIDEILPATGVNNDNTNTYTMKFTKDNALTGLNYTLSIKNIIDTNLKPNVMDDYTVTFNGIDNIDPKVTAIVQKSDNPQEIVIFFNEPMDIDSLKNSLNYYFVDGTGDTEALPYNTVITPGEDNTYVLIKFPSNYILSYGTSENNVLKVGVEYVKDKSLNTLSGIAYVDNISRDYSTGPSLVLNTVKIFYDGDDLKVQFILTSDLDNLNLNDFKIAGMTPDGGTISGRKVILTFASGIQDNVKINTVKSAGVNALLTIENPISKDIAGRTLKEGSDNVYSMQLPPRTDSSLWFASSAKGTNSVTIAFDEDIDDSIYGLYYDDFIFTNESTGGKLNPTSVSVNGKNVTYKFEDGSIKSGDKIDIHAALSPADVNIRSKKDASGENSVYIPSEYDLRIRTVISK